MQTKTKTKYMVTRFKPGGKWYDDPAVTFDEDTKNYPNEEDVVRALASVGLTNRYFHYVLMDTPWGYPFMLPALPE